VILVLDAEAVVALLEPGHSARRLVRNQIEVALRLGRDVVVTSVTLAELYRGRTRSRALDALLAREGRSVHTRDTDRGLARLVGSLLHEAGAGSALLADAHAVAAAVEVGGGIVLTADPDDLGRLAAGTGRVMVMHL
jgi:predicted nucleic acid-binding protein